MTQPVVIDSSALLELLLGEAKAEQIAAVLEAPAVSLHAPDVLDQEVISVVRRLERSGRLKPKRAEEILSDAIGFTIELHPLRPHFERVWSWRHNLWVADAYYASLAEQLDAPVLSTDDRMIRGLIAVSSVAVVDLGGG